MIRKIVVMGGTLNEGNVTQYAEANIWHDAEAARIVFETGIPIDMIGLNVTRKAPLKKDIFDGLENIDEQIREVMEKLIAFRNEESMHDAIAISSMVRDDIVIFRDAHTHIIDDDSPERGRSVASFEGDFNSRVAIDIDIDSYYRMMKDMICRYAK